MERKSSWKYDIIEAITNIGGSGHVIVICKEVYEIRNNAGRSTPNKFRQTVQRTLQNFSSDAADFDGIKEDIFCMAEGKGKGVWKLR